MRDHGSIGLPLGMGSFGGFFFGFCVFLAFDFPGFFFFCFFCLVRGEKKGRQRTGFWLVIKGRRPFQVVVSFPSVFVHLVTILYCSDIVWSKDLSAHFFQFFDQELSFLPFLLSPILWLGIFFLFFLTFSLIGNFPSFLFCF